MLGFGPSRKTADQNNCSRMPRRGGDSTVPSATEMSTSTARTSTRSGSRTPRTVKETARGTERGAPGAITKSETVPRQRHTKGSQSASSKNFQRKQLALRPKTRPCPPAVPFERTAWNALEKCILEGFKENYRRKLKCLPSLSVDNARLQTLRKSIEGHVLVIVRDEERFDRFFEDFFKDLVAALPPRATGQRQFLRSEVMKCLHP